MHQYATLIGAAVIAAIACSTTANGQDLSLGLAAGGAMRVGTKITMEVQAQARQYRFVGAVLSREGGVTYEWFTTFPAPAVWHRTLGDDLLATARAYCACHRGWEFGPVTGATSLWISRGVFEDLVERGEADFRYNPQSIEMEDAHLTFVGRETVDVIVNGVNRPLPAIVAATDAGVTFWVHDDPTDPLVLRVQGPWSARVTSILQRPDDRIGTSTIGACIQSTMARGIRFLSCTVARAWRPTIFCRFLTSLKPKLASFTSTSPVTDCRNVSRRP